MYFKKSEDICLIRLSVQIIGRFEHVQDFRLIGMIFRIFTGGECLWNVMCNNYHNRDERAEAKIRIAEKLEIRASDVETKMNSLRTYYVHNKLTQSVALVQAVS